MKISLQILVPIVIVVLAFFAVKRLIASAPEPRSKEIVEIIIQADVIESTPSEYSTRVDTFGTVSGRDQARIIPQVSARITWISDDFRVGNFVKKGDLIAKLERTDLEALHAAQLSNVADIERAITEENVLATQAEDDWIASGRDIKDASDFRLRKPQLKSLYANMEAAEFALRKAKIDINRTEITAPFDGLVAERDANLGELANTQTSLGQIYSSDKAEVRLSLTPKQYQEMKANLNFSEIPTEERQVILTPPNQPDISRSATLVRMDPVIDSRNQVLYMIAEIDHPFDEKKGRLEIGTFVKASLKGRTIPDCYKIPEAAIINDSYIWIVQEEKLNKLNVVREYTQDGFVFCKIDTPDPNIQIVSRPLVSFQVGQSVESKLVESN